MGPTRVVWTIAHVDMTSESPFLLGPTVADRNIE